MKPALKSETAGATKRGRVLGAALSLVSHLLILFALFWGWPDTPQLPEPAAVQVELIAPPGPPAKPAPSAPAAAAAKRAPPVKPPPRRPVVKPPPPDVDYIPAQVARKADVSPTLTEAQLAGAATAGSGGAGSGAGGAGGGGGGRCDMAARIQAALRKDPMVRAAVAGSAGKATLLWNGDWIRDLSEDGKGLAIVREAIMWEVAFAPPACRAQAVRGLVVVSLEGARGPTRLALGSGTWRWSDLLTPHPGAGETSDQ
jgi:hypothetical protein